MVLGGGGGSGLNMLLKNPCLGCSVFFAFCTPVKPLLRVVTVFGLKKPIGLATRRIGLPVILVSIVALFAVGFPVGSSPLPIDAAWTVAAKPRTTNAEANTRTRQIFVRMRAILRGGTRAERKWVASSA